jgi:Protein of unknown function (DUF3617)
MVTAELTRSEVLGWASDRHPDWSKFRSGKIMKEAMSVTYRVTLAVSVAALSASVALAGGIKPGLWKIISRTETGGVIGPPHETSKCLSAEEARDLATTFSPVSSTVNSVCAPIERNLAGDKLTWRLVCKGQLDMELAGEFTFDSSQHYTATMQTKAAMAGMQMVDSQNTLEGQWVSECK